MMFPQKTYTLTELADKVVNWFNNLTSNQVTAIGIILSLVITANTPKSYSNNYVVPKPITRKNFSDSTKELARQRQGQVCDICKRFTDIWEYHHKDGNRSNNSPSNCEGLCPYCHAKITRNKNSKFLY